MVKELVTIYTANGLADAHLWQERLKAEGIKAVIINENSYTTSIELQVADCNAAHARKIIKTEAKPTIRPVYSWERWIGVGMGAMFFVPGVFMLVLVSDKLPGVFFTISGIFISIVNYYSPVSKKQKRH